MSNPVFSEYAAMLDAGERALVASAFQARGEETGHLDLYAALVDALELAELGCEYVQGFLYGQPMTAAEASKLIFRTAPVDEEEEVA